MARPIMSTPTLYGKKAKKFIEDIEKNQDKKVPVLYAPVNKIEILKILDKIDSCYQKSNGIMPYKLTNDHC